MIGPNGLEGKDVIDIIAGTGNFGISALRRGANSAIFLDINKKRCEKIKLLLNQSNFKNTNFFYILMFKSFYLTIYMTIF